MEYIALAVEKDKSHLLKNARLKISEWLNFEKMNSTAIITVYLDFSNFEKPRELSHIFIVISKTDFENINLPTKDEIEGENKNLEKKELSRTMNIKGRYIPPISVKDISSHRESEEYVLIRIDFEEFEVSDARLNRFQFPLHIWNSFRKAPWLSTLLSSSWEWTYETTISPLIIGKNVFPDICQISIDLELWVMIEPTMYNSVSDLNIQSTQPFDRLVILPKDVAEKLERNPETLCIRWFFPDFSESGLGAGIVISKKGSSLEREKKYIREINGNPDLFFSLVRRILNESRVACVDFEYIGDRLEKPEFSRFLEILFQLLYHRSDTALSRLEKLIDILEQHQELRYGKYYFHMFKLLHQMRNCKNVREIIAPNIRRELKKFLSKSEFRNKINMDFFDDLKNLIDLIEQFYYYNNPEDKHNQKKKILEKITKMRDIAEHKLINPESYLITEEVLLKWEHLIEKEFEQFVGTPELRVELKTKKLLASEYVHLIFDIINIRDLPMVNLVARLLPSEQYSISEQKKRETHVRIRLTKSDDLNLRIFSPEFEIIPIVFPCIQVRLEVEFYTEEGKRFVEDFEKEIEIFHEEIEFGKIDPNPYIVGGPVKTGEMFYGRKDVFKQIRETIVGDKGINQPMVYGQHRIGKTSVLYQLMNVLKGKYVPVLASTYEFEKGDSELLHLWSSRIAETIKDRVNRVPRTPNYEKLSNPYKGFQEFLDTVIDELAGAKIIFMIDEYDLVDDLVKSKGIDKEIFGLLGRMIKHEKVELVMAGNKPVVDLRSGEWKDIGRPFVQIRLGPLDKEDAIELIKNPVANYLKYDDSAIERILRLTNCHPYLIQLCCHVLVDYHNSEKKPTLTYVHMEEKIPDIIELGSPGFEAIIWTDATEEERIVLRVMAAFLREQTSIGEEELVVRIGKYNPQIKDSIIKQALSNLEKREVIRSVTEEMRRFKFVCDLFRYWICAKMEPI